MLHHIAVRTVVVLLLLCGFLSRTYYYTVPACAGSLKVQRTMTYQRDLRAHPQAVTRLESTRHLSY